VTLKLPCGAEVPAVSQLLKMASPFFRDVLEGVTGSAPIPGPPFRSPFVLPVVCCCCCCRQNILTAFTCSPSRWTAASERGSTY
jgi:hypothetical protein